MKKKVVIIVVVTVLVLGVFLFWYFKVKRPSVSVEVVDWTNGTSTIKVDGKNYSLDRPMALAIRDGKYFVQWIADNGSNYNKIALMRGNAILEELAVNNL